MNFAPSQLSFSWLPSSRKRCAFGKPRASMTRNASVRSATASAFLPGVLTSGSPRALTASTSTFTGPPRAQQTSCSTSRRVEDGVGHRRAVDDEHLDAGHPRGELGRRALVLLEPQLRRRRRRERTARRRPGSTRSRASPRARRTPARSTAAACTSHRRQGSSSTSSVLRRPHCTAIVPLDSRDGITITSSCPDNKRTRGLMSHSAPVGIITGGLKGIGAAAAVEFGQLGARMLLARPITGRG